MFSPAVCTKIMGESFWLWSCTSWSRRCEEQNHDGRKMFLRWGTHINLQNRHNQISHFVLQRFPRNSFHWCYIKISLQQPIPAVCISWTLIKSYSTSFCCQRWGIVIFIGKGQRGTCCKRDTSLICKDFLFGPKENVAFKVLSGPFTIVFLFFVSHSERQRRSGVATGQTSRRVLSVLHLFCEFMVAPTVR